MYFKYVQIAMSHGNNDKTFFRLRQWQNISFHVLFEKIWFHVHIFYHILATATTAAEKPHLINLVIQRMFYVRPSIVKVTFSLLSSPHSLSLFFFFLPWEIFLKCKGAKNLLKSQERRILRNFKHVISGCSLLLR